MRTIPEIVAKIRELIEELESHTGKHVPGTEISISKLNYSTYNQNETKKSLNTSYRSEKEFKI
jgi:hypothetical protein